MLSQADTGSGDQEPGRGWEGKQARTATSSSTRKAEAAYGSGGVLLWEQPQWEQQWAGQVSLVGGNRRSGRGGKAAQSTGR